jgi:hypothetical protein
VLCYVGCTLASPVALESLKAEKGVVQVVVNMEEFLDHFLDRDLLDQFQQTCLHCSAGSVQLVEQLEIGWVFFAWHHLIQHISHDTDGRFQDQGDDLLVY